MEFKEEDWLQLSGIQHFAFCRRQWALIHIEQQWSENLHTVEGHVFHTRAHDRAKSELRGDKLTVRGLWVHSARLGLSGECDVVEFIRGQTGIRLPGRSGLWQVHPVEYKKGSPKDTKEGYSPDALQLCAQAICLEEMLCCTISSADLFYGETHHRVPVDLDDGIRNSLDAIVQEMHRCAERGYTPRAKRKTACKACSLAEICLPSLENHESVQEYMAKHSQGEVQ